MKSMTLLLNLSCQSRERMLDSVLNDIVVGVLAQRGRMVIVHKVHFAADADAGEVRSFIS